MTSERFAQKYGNRVKSKIIQKRDEMHGFALKRVRGEMDPVRGCSDHGCKKCATRVEIV